MGNAYKIQVRQLTVERTLRTHTRRSWDDDIKMDVREKGVTLYALFILLTDRD
jgi:hypothetical protein